MSISLPMSWIWCASQCQCCPSSSSFWSVGSGLHPPCCCSTCRCTAKRWGKIGRLGSCCRSFLKFIRRTCLKKRILLSIEIIGAFTNFYSTIVIPQNKEKRWYECWWYLEPANLIIISKTTMSLVTCINCGYESYILCCSSQPFLFSYCAGCVPSVRMAPDCQICSKSTLSIFNSVRQRLSIMNPNRNFSNQQQQPGNRCYSNGYQSQHAYQIGNNFNEF